MSLPKYYLNEGSYRSESRIYEKKISGKKKFDKYVDDILKKAHPDDFDQKIANKIKQDLKRKYKNDFGAMIGALTSGFGKRGKKKNKNDE